MMSNLRDVSGISVDCNESVITVQGLRHKFEDFIINKAKVPPPIPPRLVKLPPVPLRVLPPVPPRNKVVSVTLPAPPSGSEHDSEDDSGDSFEDSEDSFDESEDSFDESEDSFDDTEQPSLYSPKLNNIIQELIEKEQSYVDCLKTGMLNYMSALDTNDLPLSLRGQKYRIFGNIQNFYDFHKNIFLPQIIKCSQDVEQLGELFTSYIQRDSFYGYVLYALNRRKSEILCDEHVYFFRILQNACHDKLGINNFLLRPIQQLPKYKLLLSEIIKELSNDMELNKQEIAVLCVAESSVLRLLDLVNESMNINQIKNCNEIDIMRQGKFKKLSECLIYDWEQRRRYKGKLLYFEQSVIYCEVLERKGGLEYRGHYQKEKLGMSHKEGSGKFKLYEEKRGRREIIITGDLPCIQDNVTFLSSMLMDFFTIEKQQSTLKRSQSTRSIDSIRNSLMSISSGISNFSLKSSSSSGTGSHDLIELF